MPLFRLLFASLFNGNLPPFQMFFKYMTARLHSSLYVPILPVFGTFFYPIMAVFRKLDRKVIDKVQVSSLIRPASNRSGFPSQQLLLPHRFGLVKFITRFYSGYLPLLYSTSNKNRLITHKKARQIYELKQPDNRTATG